MARRLLGGVVVAIVALGGSSSPVWADPVGVMCQAFPAKGVPPRPLVAIPTSTSRDGDVTFTIGGLPGESTLRADAKGMSFFKRITADRVQVRIEVPGDSFELEAGTAGMARLKRNGKSTLLSMTATKWEVAKAQQFAAGSKALAAFESLATALESSSRPEAQSVLTSFALLHAVRGNVTPARDLAKAVQARQAANAKRAAWSGREEMPYDCWLSYAVTVGEYLVEYAECNLDYGWIPGMVAVCTFEWTVKVELAWFWLIGCSGGFPV